MRALRPFGSPRAPAARTWSGSESAVLQTMTLDRSLTWLTCRNTSGPTPRPSRHPTYVPHWRSHFLRRKACAIFGRSSLRARSIKTSRVAAVPTCATTAATRMPCIPIVPIHAPRDVGRSNKVGTFIFSARAFRRHKAEGAVRSLCGSEGCRCTVQPSTYCLGGRRPAPGKLARPSSGAVSVSPRVTVSSPGLPPDRARNGHALTSGSI